MAMSLTITVDDAGALRVEGPIDNQLVAYGLLEAARDAIQRFHAERQAAAIRPPTVEEMHKLRVIQ